METLNWMLEQEKRERPEGGVRGLNGYFWEERQFFLTDRASPQPYYYFPLCGQLSLQELPVVSGSLLSEEMGLGKTVEVISLLLASPAPYEVLQQEALTIQRIEAAEEAKLLAKAAAKEAKEAKKRKRECDDHESDEKEESPGQNVIKKNTSSNPAKKRTTTDPAAGNARSGLSRAERAATRRSLQEKEEASRRLPYTQDAKDAAEMHDIVVAATLENSTKDAKASKAAMRAFIPQCRATLIIVPVSLLLQWTKELATKAPLLKVLVMHGEKKSFTVNMFTYSNQYHRVAVLTTLSLICWHRSWMYSARMWC
jgi:hypothetical protein